jgi:DNA-binding HxlR family transcriptional regulator
MTETAAQRRAQAKVEYDVFLANCPSRALLDRISDKWVVLILCALGGEDEPAPLRFSELSRRIAAVSPKMLTQTLRSLERDGLITRTATATVPVTVTYALTARGRSLHVLTRGLRAWAQENMDDVQASREAYDQQER